MPVTLHQVLEDMAKWRKLNGPSHGKTFDEKIWQATELLLSKAVVFDFNAIDTIPREHSEFGNDLFEKGMFRLPFPVVLYCRKNMPILAWEHPAKWGADGSPIGDGLFFHSISLGPVGAGDAGQLWVAPIIEMRLEANCKASFRPAIKAGKVWREDTHAQLSDNDYRLMIEHSSVLFLGGTAMLMAKETLAEVVPAPARLNKQRALKGRPPIAECRIIKLRPEYARRAATEGESGRASPRMHWRRGHFRRVREDLVIPIAPMIINATDDARPIAKQYALKRGV